MHQKIGNLYRHLPSDTVYSITGVEEQAYGFYTTDIYTMSPWSESNANLDITVNNLTSIEWQYMYDTLNFDLGCEHVPIFIGISGAGKTACLLCDIDL